MITGINIVKDCITTGYPFIESILSAYPMCGEYLVNDGGSTDGTLKALWKLQEIYTGIRVYRFPDMDNIRWDSVSDQINKLIDLAEGGVIFLGNADELIHEKDLPHVKEQALSMIDDVLRFDRREIKQDWSGIGDDVYHPARLACNYDGIRQDWNAYGGDEFLYDHGWPDPDRKNRMNIILYHLYNMFPENYIEKLKNDALYLAPGDKIRVQIYEHMKNNKRAYSTPYKIYKNLPALARGLPYMNKYYIRDCLFDKKWVEKVTGLNYG